LPVRDEQAAVEAARSIGIAIRAGDTYRLTSPPAVRITISNLTETKIDELARVLAEPHAKARSSPQM
jgi:DNA-binding transcriptional MocR family regulator